MIDGISAAKEYVSQAHRASLEGHLDDALAHFIRASELYAAAAGHVKTKEERKQLLNLFDACAKHAEQIKLRKLAAPNASSELPSSLQKLVLDGLRSNTAPSAALWPDDCRELRELSKKEQILLLKSSSIDGAVFPIWNDESIGRHLSSTTDSQKVPRQHLPGLLETNVDRYERMTEVVHGATMQDTSRKLYTSIAQRVINDCSLVASLIVASQWSLRYSECLIGKHLFPQDDAGNTRISETGKYMMKVHLNGTRRQVTVDDFLPIDENGSATSILAFAEEHPDVVWPAIVEKIFLKVVGRDFAGSDSAHDLRLLTGWIPEEIFLQTDGLDIIKLGSTLHHNWLSGHVLITLGSGKLSEEEEMSEGVISEHNYAVVGIREAHGDYTLSLQNPWRPQREHESAHCKYRANFEMELSQARYRFSKLFLNWCPSRWPYKLTVHTTLSPEQISMTDHNIYKAPQFVLTNTSAEAQTIFILLERHRPLRPLFTSLAVFPGSERVVTSSSALARSDFHGSSHTSLEPTIAPSSSTIIAIIQKPPSAGEEEDSKSSSCSSHATLTVFCSTRGVSLEPCPAAAASIPLLHHHEVRDAWRPSGGPFPGPLCHSNPRYLMTLPTTAKILHIILETEPHISAHFALIHGHAHVASLTRNNTRYSATHLTMAHTSVALTHVEAGDYALLLSTGKAGDCANYALTILTDTAGLDVRRGAVLGAGQVKHVLASHWSRDNKVQRFQLTTPRMNTLTIHVHAPRIVSMQCTITTQGHQLDKVEGQGSVGLNQVTLQRNKTYNLSCELIRGMVECEFEIQVFSDGILQLSRC